MDLLKLVRPNIRDLKPYSSARSEYKGVADVFLDANENPFETGLNRYPDPLQCKLKAEIEKLNPEAFAYFHQAKQKDPSLSEHLIVHKPWIDHVTFPCPSCGATMKRVPEVIDCWFDSGCMPFAQWGFPHAEGSKESFDKSFPADFISEAIDQTRGWFYSLLMISTLVFDPENPESARMEFMVDTPSVDTGNAGRDDHLRSGDFFNAPA